MKILKKLKSRRGETLVEILVSMAILTLSICFMVTMVMLSARFDEQARAEDVKFKEALEAVENFDGATVEHGKQVKLVPTVMDGTPTQSIDVEVYSSADGELKSYKLP